ncbi:chloride channel protein [Alteromonas oceanisediminis]|uniref:chloride channel protein n=1 Tax=Alteromonas oceanisediminis TaxID=2836180 RepID=UPI001BD964BB|nr:chloride channel protein [Alteromonas oceanisediminis]MBT0585262.1 chloride channel protein [Alteromonas oceanisediminis]
MSLHALRYELAHPRTSVQLCVLGIVAGVIAASIIIVFRLCYEWIQLQVLSHIGAFDSVSPLTRFFMPIAAIVGILLVAYLTGFRHYRLGIPFVIHRVKYHFGHIPFRTTINQFFGGMLALASGFSVGREGPSVHLGAAGSSFIGQSLKLPFNSIRILAGCGIAAGISASFNTPFAAVIFVMEVVLREYRIHMFVPVMLAAACGSLLTRAVFGEFNELAFLSFAEFDLWIYAYLVVFGVLLGGLAALFNRNLMFVMRLFRRFGMHWRLVLAASITAIIGSILPEAMGGSFEAVETLFADDPGLWLLAVVLLAKFVLTITAIGLGVPGGIMGPVMILGMIAGALLLVPVGYFVDVTPLTNSFALLGVAGMLTAVLHAPLAALSAVMELSYNPQIILPAMLVIVPAYVTSTQFLKNRSIFLQQLDYQKLPYATSSVRETLQKTGVLAVMDTQFKVFYDAPDKAILAFLDKSPTHPVVQRSHFELDVQFKLVAYNVSLEHDGSPLSFSSMAGLSSQATLSEVYDVLQSARSGAVYIYGDKPDELVGIVNWNTLQSYLMKEQ